jgi:hypothetical protein
MASLNVTRTELVSTTLVAPAVGVVEVTVGGVVSGGRFVSKTTSTQ